MFYIAVLFVCLLVMLWFCHMSSKRILLTPQFCFLVSFILATGYALISNDYIQLDMSFKTFVVLLGGVYLFVVVSLVYMSLKSNVNVRSYLFSEVQNKQKFGSLEAPISIDSWLLIVFLLIEIWVTISYRSFYLGTTGLSTYAEALYTYRFQTMFTSNEVEYVSSYLLLARRLCVASGYVFSYLMIHARIYKYKSHNILLLANIVMTVILNTLSGSRGPAVTYVIAIVIQYYLMLGNSKGWINVIKFKHICLALGIAAAIICSFELFGNILGRSSTKTLADYLAVYISAPLKNLDSFIEEGKFGAPIAENQTLVYAVNYLAKVLGISSWTHSTYQPFRYNSYGRGLGNVYTTFYAFLYDGGILGLIFFTVLMAIICQIVFRKATKVLAEKKKRIRISIIAYSYIVPYLLQCFFSNKFFENIFNPLFCLYLVAWFAFSYYLTHIKIKLG